MKYTTHIEIDDTGELAKVTFLLEDKEMARKEFISATWAIVAMAEWCEEGRLPLGSKASS